MATPQKARFFRTRVENLDGAHEATGRGMRFKIRNPKPETNPNDPNEICCAFHRAGQNSNDEKKGF
jgi:hypothetical protein